MPGARFFIVAEMSCQFRPTAPGSFEGTGINRQCRIEGAKGGLKIRMGERRSSADRGNTRGDWTIPEAPHEALGSVRILLIGRGRGGSGKRCIARVRRKIPGEGTFLLQQDRVAV